MKNRVLALGAACVLLALVAGCGQARTAASQGGEGASASVCTACHGGTSDGTGAPPKDTKGRTATTEVTVGAHTAHTKGGRLAAPIACVACHARTVRLDSPAHMDGTTQVEWSGPAIAKGATPVWDRATATCSNVYCHGVTLPGGPTAPLRWTTVDGTQGACGACHGVPPVNHPELAAGFTLATCSACHPETVKADGSIDADGGRHVNGTADGFAGHPSGWLDRSSTSFHGLVSASGTAACTACHAMTPPAKASAVTCSKCHANAGSGDFGVNCSSCHGSTASAAPPRDLSGNTATSFVGVGAHQSHVLGTHRFAAPLACTSCHPQPEDMATPGHLDGTVQVTGYTGLDPDLAAQVTAPGWSRASATCAASYCHGGNSSSSGGAVPAPVWTRTDGSQVFCGSCHGLPPRIHPALAAGSDARTCGACHPGTTKDDGTIDVAAGQHLNGRVDGFAGHPAPWMTKGDTQFHGQVVVRNGATACFGCHTATRPARVSAISCATCHDLLAGGDWTRSCVGCHGSAANAAPPKDTHLNTATTFPGVGAHQSHVTGSRGLAAPMDCVFCHEKPGDVFAVGHMDGTVQLTGYRGADPALQAVVTTQGWDDAAATCANYCHGATLDGGTASRPQWTKVDGSQSACGACHGLPGARHLALAPGATAASCAPCHATTVRPDGTIDVPAGKHLNGRIDSFGGHPDGWMNATSSAFHGKPENKDNPACFTCHAKVPPAQGTAFTCANCHTNVASGDWRTACNSCHGSATSDAPPRDLLRNTATTFVGVGAHQSHLQGTHGVAAPFDCTACHPKPTDAMAAPHLDGRVEVTGYTGADPALRAAVTDPGWNRAVPSCGTSYCHGATLGGGMAMQPVWTRVDGSQASCGSCHGLPPTGHMTLTPPVTAVTCAACHPATVRPDGSIDVAGGRHVNGTVETEGFAGHGTGWLVPGDPAFHGRAAVADGMDTCFQCHSAKEPSTNGIRTCASCHDALAGGDWTTSCVGCHGSGASSAPPKDVHGNTATTAIGVGAHRSHVEAPSGIAQRYDCSTCHQKPSVVFSPGHLDGSTTVTGYTGTDPSLRFIGNPGWNRTNASCSTSWCHGGYSGVYTYSVDDGSGTLVPVDFAYAGKPNAPTWNRVDGTQAACGTCHGVPPSPSGYWHSGLHGGAYNACSLCHPGVDATGAGFTDTASHVNGVVDVTPKWGSKCFGCH